MPAIASGRRNSVASSAQPVRASKRRQSCTAALPSPAEQPEWPKKRRQVKNACETTCLDSVRKERKKGVSRGPYKRKEGDEESSASPQGTPGLDQQLSESGPFPSASDDGDADEGKADAAGDRYEQNTDSDSGSDSEDPEDFNVEDSTEVVCRKEDAEARDGCGYDKLAILSNLCTAVLQQSETCSEDGKKVLDEAAFEFDGRDGRVYYISGSDGEESEIASNFPVLPSFGSLQTMCDAAVIAQDERTPVRGEIVSSLGPPSRIAQLDVCFAVF
ncbi:hypothetical protein HKX48_008123 [Thoreauomyces humboldtii]|nr:hypothetical protein HKX48_008123 [Thoreauomyces humboldtii]